AQQVLRYALLRQGMLAVTGAPLRAFGCSREGLEAPDLMLGWIPMLTEPSPRGPRISRQSGLTLYAQPMHPASKGHVHITAADRRRWRGRGARPPGEPALLSDRPAQEERGRRALATVPVGPSRRPP